MTFSWCKLALEVITLTDFAGLLMSFEPECSASVLSHAFQLFELHRGGDPSVKSARLGKTPEKCSKPPALDRRLTAQRFWDIIKNNPPIDLMLRLV